MTKAPKTQEMSAMSLKTLFVKLVFLHNSNPNLFAIGIIMFLKYFWIVSKKCKSHRSMSESKQVSSSYSFEDYCIIVNICLTSKKAKKQKSTSTVYCCSKTEWRTKGWKYRKKGICVKFPIFILIITICLTCILGKTDEA